MADDVTLREITNDNLRSILVLEVHEAQRNFVAPNSWSIAEAHFSEIAFFRGIYAGDRAVGFAMLSVDRDKSEYWVWRFMIAAAEQGRGFGRAAMKLLVDHVRSLPGATELKLSYVPKDGNPSPFYAKLGFVETGEVEDGERVMSLALA